MEISNAVFIGRDIYDCLKTLVDGKVYPVIAEESSTQPFIVYYRNNMNFLRCKDGTYQANISFTVQVVADKYQESLEIAALVIDNILRGINHVELVGSSEEYSNDGYIQTLNFNIELI